MLNDDVPPTPGTRKHFGVSAESQRLLINFETVMSEHSVAELQLEEVSDIAPRQSPGAEEAARLKPSSGTQWVN